jgi:hypothetical protein
MYAHTPRRTRNLRTQTHPATRDGDTHAKAQHRRKEENRYQVTSQGGFSLCACSFTSPHARTHARCHCPAVVLCSDLCMHTAMAGKAVARGGERSLRTQLTEKDKVGVQDFVLLQDYTSQDAFINNLKIRFNANLIYVRLHACLLVFLCSPALSADIHRQCVRVHESLH